MIIELLGPFHLKTDEPIGLTRVVVACDKCEKQWQTSWGSRSKRDYDFCQSCKNRLGISGMKGKQHSVETKRLFSVARSGDKNVSKRPDVRKKLSKSLKGRKVPWLKGKKRPEHAALMSERMTNVWSTDCEERRNHMDALARMRDDLCRGHSKFHDEVKTELINAGMLGFESEQIVGKLFVDEMHREKNIVVEVMGDFWHANPTKYAADELMNFPGRCVLASDVWKRDDYRRSQISAQGYAIIEIWESDWKANKSAQVERVRKALDVG